MAMNPYAHQADMKIVMKVDGIACPICQQKVTSVVQRITGGKYSINIDFQELKVTVEGKVEATTVLNALWYEERVHAVLVSATLGGDTPRLQPAQSQALQGPQQPSCSIM